MDGQRAYWLAWQSVPGIGPVLIRRLEEHFGSLSAAWQAEAGKLAAVGGGPDWGAVVAARRQIDPLALLQRREREWPPFWTPADPDYPALLREIPDPPPLLFWRGEQSCLVRPAVAVVGTRRPSAYGWRWATKIADALARAGFLVVSGLALGIDGEAHRGALAAGAPTAAVLGSDLNDIYPPQHRELSKQIARTGLLLSELAPDTPWGQHVFPRRNRIIVGMSLATIVIEAPARSGALISAHLACDYNRELFVLPAPLGVPQAEGNLRLIAQGARLVLGIEQLLADLGSHLVHTSRAGPDDPEERRIWEALAGVELNFDELCERTGLVTAELADLLLQLELRGLVRQRDTRYGRA